jgi:NADH-quinone oxidoreductase subunit J
MQAFLKKLYNFYFQKIYFLKICCVSFKKLVMIKLKILLNFAGFLLMIQSIVFYIFSFFLIGSSAMVVFSRNPVHSVLFLIFSFFNCAGIFIILKAEFIAMILVIVYVGAIAILFLFVVMMVNIRSGQFSKTSVKNTLIPFFKFFVYLIGLIALTGVLFFSLIYASSWLGFKFSWRASSLNNFVILGFCLLLSRFCIQKMLGSSLRNIFNFLISSSEIYILLGFGLLIQIVLVLLGWNITIKPMDIEKYTSTNTHDLGKLLYSDYIYLFQGSGIVLMIAMIGTIALTLRRKEGIKSQDIHKQMSRTKENSLLIKDVPIGKGIL